MTTADETARRVEVLAAQIAPLHRPGLTRATVEQIAAALGHRLGPWLTAEQQGIPADVAAREFPHSVYAACQDCGADVYGNSERDDYGSRAGTLLDGYPCPAHRREAQP